MPPYNQPTRQTEQPMHGGPPSGQPEGPPPEGGPPPGVQQPQPISEMTVSTPTLRWISIGHPGEQIPIGPDDYVLDSVYNHQIDAWEVLVIVQPREAEADEKEDDEEE